MLSLVESRYGVRGPGGGRGRGRDRPREPVSPCPKMKSSGRITTPRRKARPFLRRSRRPSVAGRKVIPIRAVPQGGASSEYSSGHAPRVHRMAKRSEQNDRCRCHHCRSAARAGVRRPGDLRVRRASHPQRTHARSRRQAQAWGAAVRWCRSSSAYAPARISSRLTPNARPQVLRRTSAARSTAVSPSAR